MDSPARTDIVAVVVSWNSGPWLAACIDALVAQQGGGIRIVVWDNASEKPTLDVLGELARRHPAITVHHSDRNLGFAAGNNRAIALAGPSRHVLTVNPDVVMDSDCVARMRAALEDDLTTVAVGATQLASDRQTLDGTGDVLHVSGIAWRAGHGQPVPPPGRLTEPGAVPEPAAPTEPGALRYPEIFSPCAALALYRRDAFDAVHGFDEAYFCYFEDVDLGYRLRLNGGVCRYVPQARAVHVGSVSTGKDSDFTLYHGHRNLLWTFVKDTPGPLLWLLLPLHLAMTAFVTLVFAARGRGAVIWRAKRDALRRLPDMLSRRGQIQRSRVAGARQILLAMTVNPRRR